MRTELSSKGMLHVVSTCLGNEKISAYVFMLNHCPQHPALAARPPSFTHTNIEQADACPTLKTLFGAHLLARLSLGLHGMLSFESHVCLFFNQY